MVLHGTKIQETLKKYDYSTSLSQSTNSPFSYSNFLKEWKKSYTLQKEILLFVFQYASSGVLLDKKIEKDVNFYEYLDNLSLYQMKNLEDLRLTDQNGMARESLVEYVRHVIYRNQNPKECKNIEVIGYELKEICGFGCQIHHLAYCLTVALGEGKPLVVKPSKWHGFDSIFDIIMPLSDTCHYYMIHLHRLKVKFIELEYKYRIKQFLPQTFPENIRNQIEEFHTHPFLWWIGQIMMYILRLRPHIIMNLRPIEFTSPIVGVHVRRTDKLILEAKFYPVEEYMKYVQLYFRKLELTSKVPKKSVYLAVDDWQVVAEFRRK
ncbi:Alpha-(1,6)-fucosyltransferase [Thelohanellus kitauei]|uniref:Alpha-(1,6)-fucosyltransferase n=1 Tax=Thelohanellus kitauei TaxID=669202 RepID=A0A0C2M9T8_THEKT|nr:Alpha-(1,6)-fucosyltransferase [Thelohanellus kitauei]